MDKVYVAGSGIISCLGSGWAETFNALSQTQSGLSRLTYQDFSLMAGVVPLTNDELAHRAGTDLNLPRAALMGIHAAKEAYLQSGIQHMERWRVGMVSSSMFGGMDRTEEFFSLFRNNTTKGKLRDVFHYTPGRITELIAQSVNVNDFFTTISTGNSSALNALILGNQLIANDQLDVVFVGGTDALSQYMISGFRAEGLLDAESSRPFDASCNGLNPGEGSAYLVLTSDRVREAENIPPLAEFSGYGANNFINNTFPSRVKEEAAFQCMADSIQSASLSPQHVQYVNLFGTGVPELDLIESAAIMKLFGFNPPAMSSTKALSGFTSGACGAMESVFSIMAMAQQCVLKSAGFEREIPEVGVQPERYFSAREIDHVMVNSFSFLGNCSSVLFSKSTS